MFDFGDNSRSNVHDISHHRFHAYKMWMRNYKSRMRERNCANRLLYAKRLVAHCHTSSELLKQMLLVIPIRKFVKKGLFSRIHPFFSLSAYIQPNFSVHKCVMCTKNSEFWTFWLPFLMWVYNCFSHLNISLSGFL